MRKGNGQPSDSAVFRNSIVPLGCQGFVTGIEISADGSRIACRTDVTNGFLREAGDTAWRPMFTKTSVSPEMMAKLDANGTWDAAPGTANGGVCGMRFAPSNGDIIYAAWHGFMWKTTDFGYNWTRQSLNKRFLGNGDTRKANRAVDVHPTNPNIVIVGTWNDGVHYTTNGGDTWLENTSLPAPGASDSGAGGNPRYLVLIDPENSLNVYVHVYKVGLHRSTTGVAGTFSLVSATPNKCHALVYGPDDNIWMLNWTEENRDGNGNRTYDNTVYRYTPGGATATFAFNQVDPCTLAFDPFTNHLYVGTMGGGFSRSTNIVTPSFTSLAGARSPLGDVAAVNAGTSLFAAEMKFHPSIQNEFWLAEGVAANRCVITGSSIAYICQSLGIEMLIPQYIMAAPGGGQTIPIVTCQDRAFIKIKSFEQAINLPKWPDNAGSTANKGYQVDWAIDDEDFLVGCVNGPNLNGYSDDRGESWKRFVTGIGTDTVGGGAIAVSTKNNIITCPTNGGAMRYTLDGGATWPYVQFGGESAITGQVPQYTFVRYPLASCKSRPGVFGFVYNNIDTSVVPNQMNKPNAGFWLTQNGGVSWVKKFSGTINDKGGTWASPAEGMQFWQCLLMAVPGRPGEWVYSPSHKDLADYIWKSTNDGESWHKFGGAAPRQAMAFAFGKGLPGSEYPAFYYYGQYNGLMAVWATFDWFATPPRKIADTRSRQLANIQYYQMAGDPNEFGVVYVGYGVGVERLDYKDVATAT